MQQENDDNVQKVGRPDTRRYQAQDNEGHIKGSHQEGSSQESMKKEREKDDNDDSELNQTDARGNVGGNEAI